MKKPVLIALVATVLLGGGFAGMRWATEWRWIESTDDAYVDGDITAIVPKVAGHVAEVVARDNRPVAKGDVLARIDDRDYRARVDEAQAQVAARMAQLMQIEDRQAVQKALVAQSGASISAARADVVRARADFQRTSTLVKDDIVSKQRYDISMADAAKAQASLTGSDAGLKAAERQLSVLAAEKVMTQAQMEQARAALTLAETDLEAATIRAPVDGVVGNRAVRDGQYVRPGQMLMAVVPMERLWIDANFKETQLARMKPGQKVEIRADALPDRVITGRLDSLAPATGAKFSLLPPENATGNFTKVVQRVPVRIIPDESSAPSGLLRPGLSVVVRVDTRP